MASKHFPQKKGLAPSFPKDKQAKQQSVYQHSAYCISILTFEQRRELLQNQLEFVRLNRNNRPEADIRVLQLDVSQNLWLLPSFDEPDIYMY